MTAKTSVKKIDTAIASFVINRDKLKVQAHTIAMMVFMHAAPAAVSEDCGGTGDCTRAIKIVEALPKSWASQMTEWFKAFSPIRVVAKNGKCEYDPKYKTLTPEEKVLWWKISEANETPFYDFVEPEAADKVLDFAALVLMVQRLSKQIEKKVEEGKVAPEDIESAHAIARAVSGLDLKRVKASAANDPATPETPATVDLSAAA